MHCCQKRYVVRFATTILTSVLIALTAVLLPNSKSKPGLDVLLYEHEALSPWVSTRLLPEAVKTGPARC